MDLKNKSFFVLSAFLVSSCVSIGQVDIKDNKLDTKVDAKAQIELNTNANLNLNKSGTSLSKNDNNLVDLDRFSEVRYIKERDGNVDYNNSQSRLFDDNKKIDSISFNKIGFKGNLNSYLELIYDSKGIKKSENLIFEYSEESKNKSITINSKGDFETFNNGMGFLLIKDNINKISKKISISVYDRSIVKGVSEPLSDVLPPTISITSSSIIDLDTLSSTFFREMDKNKDDSISDTEFGVGSKEVDRIFNEFDTYPKDKKINKTEWQSIVSSHTFDNVFMRNYGSTEIVNFGTNWLKKVIERVFTESDLNSDDILSKKELFSYFTLDLINEMKNNFKIDESIGIKKEDFLNYLYQIVIEYDKKKRHDCSLNCFWI